MPVIYAPSLCILAQSEKVAQLARGHFRYDLATILLAAVNRPVTGAVTKVSGEEPYPCLMLEIDRGALGELITNHPNVMKDDARVELALPARRRFW